MVHRPSCRLLHDLQAMHSSGACASTRRLRSRKVTFTHRTGAGLAYSAWFVGIAGAYVALGYAARTWQSFAVLALLAGIGLFLCTAYVEFLLVLDEDDWWDGFRSQNRTALLASLLQVLAVAGGTWFGWHIAG